MQFIAAATRLLVVVEADPSALVRVLHFFQSRNVVPLLVGARRAGAETIELEVEVAVSDLDAVAMNIITAKVKSLSIAFSARCAVGRALSTAVSQRKNLGQD